MQPKITGKWVRSPLTVSITFLVVCILAYGLLIPTLGYYWDDWPYAWFNHMFGPGGYPAYVALDRPYSAWIFMALAFLFGEQPLGYHISALVLYWICAVLFWWLIKLVWPNHKREAFWGALLFAVYPGFLGHPQGIIYNHHFVAMALYLFSLVGMVKTLRKWRRDSLWRTVAFWYFPSILALLISQFTIEYFLGWEVVRPLLVWFVIKDRRRQEPDWRLNGWLILLPYWLVTLGFLMWRILIFQFPTYQPFFSNPDFVLSDFFLGILNQIFQASLLAWGYVFPKLSRGDFSRWFWAGYLALWIVAAAFVFLLLRFRNRDQRSESESGERLKSGFWYQGLILAFLGIIFAGLPFWLTGLSLNISNPFSSRFTLPFIPWIALFIVSVLHLASKIHFKWISVIVMSVVAILVGGSTAWHFWNANVYRNNWMEVQQYFQQLVQRMPGIEPGTSVVINDMRSLRLYQDDSLTAILNWTYAPDFRGEQMPYMMQYLSVRLGDEIPALQPGLPIEQDYRSLYFSGSTIQIILVYYESGGCVRVLDESDLYQLPKGFPDAMVEALPLSNLSLIQADAPSANLPLHLFDLETEDTWCMNFQKADLAAQVGDWERVASLGDYAYGRLQNPSELSEWFVFLEGYLRVGRLESALELSQDLSAESEGLLDDEVCTLWRQIEVALNVDYFEESPVFCGSQ